MDIQKEAIYTITLSHPEATALRLLLGQEQRSGSLPDVLHELEDSLDRVV